MELINHTGVNAELMVGDIGDAEGGDHRRTGCLVAKATFDARNGRVELVTDEPIPLFHEPASTPLGLLPSDVRLRQDGPVELVLLGCARAPTGRPVETMTVELRVGDLTRRLSVFGDRRWVGMGDEAVATPPAPFEQMPLTWERAYGGTLDVWMDEHTVVPIEHLYNAFGRGADPAKIAARVASGQCSPGFPRFHTERLLPNLENPSETIARWEDEPLPYCWATQPGTLGLKAAAIRHLTSPEQMTPELRELLNQEQLMVSHPDLRFDRLPGGAPVRVTGCTSGGPWEFALPALRLGADYVLGGRTGHRHLNPTVVVLLPEERRLSITYQAWFRFTTSISDERSLRLVMEEAA